MTELFKSLIDILKETQALLSEIPAPCSYGQWERMCDLQKRIETILGDASTRKDEGRTSQDEDKVASTSPVISSEISYNEINCPSCDRRIMVPAPEPVLRLAEEKD